MNLSPLTESVLLEAAQVLKPPPRLSISQWAEQNFLLSSEDSALAGQYRCANAPYQREMLDAVQEPGIERVVFWTGAQMVKTLALKIILAYYMKEDPCPMAYLLPSLPLARRWSKQRLAPMLRDNPSLRGLVEEGMRKSGNSLLEKEFPGGILFVLGAMNAAALASYPLRAVFVDEEDRMEISARGASGAGEGEGDPVALIEERTTTFWNAFVIEASTCTLEGISRIVAKYQISDQRKYWVPCPHCGEFQLLSWKRLIWSKEQDPTPENVCYACEHCAAALYETEKMAMLRAGQWRKGAPEVRNCAGFWISQMYSPFTTWAKMVQKFRDAMSHRENPEKLKVFVNTALAETWKADEEAFESGDLMARREEFPPPAVPDGATVLTAAVDVQGDRLELEVWGWGRGEEAWGIDRLVFPGDPAKPQVWEQLDRFLLDARYLHARGVRLEIAATFVDAGYLTAEVMGWTKPRKDRRIFAIRGFDGFRRPPLGRPSKANRARTLMYPVGVDVIKEILYARLRIRIPGAGYLHFSKYKHDAEYFGQLTCERLKRKYVRGFAVRYWVKPLGARNEALDLWAYNYGAFLSLSPEPGRMLEALRKQLLERAKYAAAARREKVDPNQLALLGAPDALPAAAEGVPPGRPALQTSAEEVPGTQSPVSPVPSEEKPETRNEKPETSSGFGAEEYKVAERLDGEKPAPEPPRPPQIRVKRSRWL